MRNTVPERRNRWASRKCVEDRRRSSTSLVEASSRPPRRGYIRRRHVDDPSYELFPDAPSERVMARARYLAREGRVGDAEKAYRDVLAAHPDLKPCWAECFELLRSHGRREEALHLAEGARAQFGDVAFPLTLKGAALIELERYREALGA